MPRIIAIMNQKGGVGKTTTTLNLGAALAARGKRVLLVDLDPQANLTLGVGLRAADLSESVYELLTNPKVETAKLVVKTKWDGLHLVPSHIDLSGAELEMVTMIGRETRLAKALEPVRNEYDYIFIDCLPSLSLLTVNAMAVSTEVFVPLQAHPFALEGLGKLFEVVGMIREAMNPALRVSGVLVTMFDGRTNVSKVTLEMLRRDERLREHIFTTTIKQNIKVAESQKEGVPVTVFDPSCHAAKAYQALCEEVLEMESGVLASLCGERITARQRAAGEKITFTPDLIAPASKQQDATSSIPAASETHVAGVTALVGGTDRNAEAAPIGEEKQTPVAEVTKPPQVEITTQAPPVPAPPEPAAEISAITAEKTDAPRNTADAESLHPSAGAAMSFPPDADAVAAAQAAQSGISLAPHEPVRGEAVHAGAGADVSDEDYRPRLQLRPSSLNIPLPPGEALK